MPRVTHGLPDDARVARAWAAFAAEDRVARPPAALEARVLDAARAALAAQRRADCERRRRQWLAGTSAIAASLLAAAGWWLVPSRGTSVAHPPAEPPANIAVAAPAPTPARFAVTTTPGRWRPIPMTNVEAGRVLATPPQRMLPARPLFDPADGAVIRVAGVPRPRSFFAPLVEPAAYARAHTTAPAAPPAAQGTSDPRPAAATAVAGTAPEAWSSRGFKGVFDAGPARPAPDEPAWRLEQVMQQQVRPVEDDPPPPSPQK